MKRKEAYFTGEVPTTRESKRSNTMVTDDITDPGTSSVQPSTPTEVLFFLFYRTFDEKIHSIS